MTIKKALWHIEQFLVYRILHADDSPHRLALGIAIGIFYGFSPMIGLQMIAAVLTASLLKANKLVGLPLVWLSNPFTILPLFYLNYHVGRVISQLLGLTITADFAQIRQSLRGLTTPGEHYFDWAFWKGFLTAVFDVSRELWLGSVVVGLAAGLISYGLGYYGIRWYRQNFRRWRREWVAAHRKKPRARRAGGGVGNAGVIDTQGHAESENCVGDNEAVTAAHSEKEHVG